MRRIYVSLIYASAVLIFTSCIPKYVTFNKEEKEWFNIYNKDDALIFQNVSTGEKDISIITYKRIYHDNDLFRHDNIIHCVDIDYFNKKSISQNGYDSMFGYCKGDKSETGISISYLGSHFRFERNSTLEFTDTLSVSKKIFTNVYKSTYKRLKYPAGTDDDPEILYWDKNYGIIKYVTFNGEVWERINWK